MQFYGVASTYCAQPINRTMNKAYDSRISHKKADDLRQHPKESTINGEIEIEIELLRSEERRRGSMKKGRE